MKPLQVFWNGKHMRDVYPFATPWEVQKYKMRRLVARMTKLLFVLVLLAGGFAGAFFAGSRTYPITIHAVEERLVQVDSLTGKLDEFKAGMIDKIKSCESPGYSEKDAPIILDSNNQMSIGLYMYQIKTVIHYYKTLYQRDITRKEAVEIALDESKARQLTWDVVFTTKDGWKNWTICSNRKGIVADLAMLERLEK